MANCEHKWVYKRTRHEKVRVCGSSDIIYRLVDEYYCSKCLQQNEVITHTERTGFYSTKPAWFGEGCGHDA